jgi:hypothetical protein
VVTKSRDRRTRPLLHSRIPSRTKDSLVFRLSTDPKLRRLSRSCPSVTGPSELFATRAGVLLAYLMQAFEVPGMILHLRALFGADLLALKTAAGASPLPRAQLPGCNREGPEGRWPGCAHQAKGVAQKDEESKATKGFTLALLAAQRLGPHPSLMIGTMAMPQCIFCDNESGSKEHLWSAWIHGLIRFGPIRVQHWNDPEFIDVNPERTINTICKDCNNVYFSQLENKVSAFMKPIIQGMPTRIDRGRLGLLIKWSMKTAMVLDSIRQETGGEKFYRRASCVDFRTNSRIPASTRIWIAALSKKELGAYGRDFSLQWNSSRVGKGTATTVIAGHFVVQILTEGVFPQYIADKISLQESTFPINPDYLIEIYPKNLKEVEWPPSKTFTLSNIHILTDRWRGDRHVARVEP